VIKDIFESDSIRQIRKGIFHVDYKHIKTYGLKTYL